MSQVNPNRSYDALIGRHYDWPYGGNNAIGTEWAGVQNVYGAQPINQVNKRVNGKYPPGGDWIAYQRSYKRRPSDHVEVARPGYGYAYKGGFVLAYPGPSAIPNDDSLYSEGALGDIVGFLEGLGAEGFAKARPAKPDFSVATNLLELKDVPGMLRQSIHLCIERILRKNPKLYYDYGRNGFFRVRNKTRLSATAEWYLAINFGWLPIISGVRDFIKASHGLDRSLKQLLKDEGKVVRRRRVLKRKDDSSSSQIGSEMDFRTFDLPEPSSAWLNGPHPGLRPILVTQCYLGKSYKFEEEYTVHQLIEFVAAFRYWLPDGPRDNMWTARLRRRMLGSRITPSVAWNLMPWTFLADYFSTLGKAIENLGPGVEDQLYTEYCYVTYREDIRRTIRGTIGTYGFKANSLVSDEKPVFYQEHSKLRVRVSADPFAFRFRGGEMSLKQKAILAALAAK